MNIQSKSGECKDILCEGFHIEKIKGVDNL